MAAAGRGGVAARRDSICGAGWRPRILGENSGLDVQKPIPFVPAGSRPTGLSIVEARRT